MTLVLAAFLGVSLAANVVLVLAVLGLRGSIRAQTAAVTRLESETEKVRADVYRIRESLPKKRVRRPKAVVVS